MRMSSLVLSSALLACLASPALHAQETDTSSTRRAATPSLQLTTPFRTSTVPARKTSPAPSRSVWNANQLRDQWSQQLKKSSVKKRRTAAAQSSAKTQKKKPSAGVLRRMARMNAGLSHTPLASKAKASSPSATRRPAANKQPRTATTRKPAAKKAAPRSGRKASKPARKNKQRGSGRG